MALARALVNRPSLLIADEPTGNLDPETSWEIMKLIDEINHRGTTVIVATHEKGIVDSMKKRVIAIRKGEIIRINRKDSIKMKLRTGRYILKEGIINIHKNILMSFASITVVTASLIILGGFFAIIANINHNINRLSEKPEMGVFCNAQLDDSEVASIEWLIMSDDRIKEYTIVTKRRGVQRSGRIIGQQQIFNGRAGK